MEREQLEQGTVAGLCGTGLRSDCTWEWPTAREETKQLGEGQGQGQAAEGGGLRVPGQDLVFPAQAGKVF